MEKTNSPALGALGKYAVVLLIAFFVMAFTNKSSVSTDKVDLSLILKVHDAVPVIGDKVSVNITLANLSQTDATGIDVVVNIPEGLGNFSNISHGGVQRGNQLIWSNRSQEANSSNGFLFNTEVLVAGEHVLTAEILDAHQEDIDSNPGNGVDPDRDGLIGSYDQDENYDSDDEDDADDAFISAQTEEEVKEVVADKVVIKQNTPKKKKDLIAIFPNPTSGQLNVAITQENEGAVTIQMYDQKGNHILTQDVQSLTKGQKYEQLLDVSYLAAGTYVLNIRIGEISYIKRAMIVK